jgi:hypothetical protein
VYEQVNDFHKWESWSPWEHLDPTMKRSFAGAENGTGAEYSWVGNGKVGEGRMTIVESDPGSKVDIKLEFLKPFSSTNQALFAFSPEGEGTKVTWSMNGPMNFMSKVMCVFQDMDKMIGPDFEKGLASLKTVAEAAPPAAAADTSAAAAMAAQEKGKAKGK